MILADFYGVSTDYILGRTNRKEGMVSVQEKLTNKYSAGEVLSDIASLTPERRSTIVDFVMFLKSCEEAEKSKEKDGK